jgi:hypothetical protein
MLRPAAPPRRRLAALHRLLERPTCAAIRRRVRDEKPSKLTDGVSGDLEQAVDM